MIKSGIYQILNTINGKFYIGSAKNISARVYEHERQLNNNKHSNCHLQYAWNKYGIENFKFQVVEYCEVEKLIEREQFWIDNTNCCKIGYNLSPTAGSQLNFKHSEKTKKLISEKARNISEKTRAKMKAHIFSNEHKKNMSVARKNRIIKDETRLKLSIAGKGRRHTVEAKEKVAASKRGIPRSEETKAKLRLAALKQWEIKKSKDSWIN